MPLLPKMRLHFSKGNYYEKIFQEIFSYKSRALGLGAGRSRSGGPHAQSAVLTPSRFSGGVQTSAHNLHFTHESLEQASPFGASSASAAPKGELLRGRGGGRSATSEDKPKAWRRNPQAWRGRLARDLTQILRATKIKTKEVANVST